MKSARRHIVLALKIVLSVSLIYFLYRKTPLIEMKEVLGLCNVALLSLVFCILLVNTSLSALKWQILLRSDNIGIPLHKLIVSYLIGSFFNLFLPSNIGGDSYRIYDIMQKSGEGVRTAASVFADRLSGFLALTIVSLLSSVVVALRLGRPLLILFPSAVLCLLGLAIFLLWQKKPVLWLCKVTHLDRSPQVLRFFDKFFAAFARYGSEPGTIAKVMLISFLFQFLLIVAVYWMALSIQAQVPFIYFLAFVPLITLMEAVPISVYGIGVRDMGYVFFFGFAGMGEIQTRTLALVFLIVTLCYSLLGGGLYLGRVLAAGRAGKKR